MAVTMKQIAQLSGVSTMTVSRVLNNRSDGQVSFELAQRVKECAEKLGYRQNLAAQMLRNKSSFLTEASVTKSYPKITMLLPRPEFLRQGHSIPVERQLGVFEGIMSAASEIGAQVETIAVSNTNNIADIQWQNLQKLDENSCVIACSFWFTPVLFELHKRNCKIALTTAEVYYRKLYNMYCKDWLLLTTSNSDSAVKMFQQLVSQGCRKIAVLDYYINEPEEPIKLGIESQLNLYKNVQVRYLQSGLQPFSELKEYLANCYNEEPFDGIILHGNMDNWNFRLSPNENLGLPENVKLVRSYDCQDHTRLTPGLNAITYPWQKIGYDATMSLLADNFIAKEKFYNGELIIRNQKN